MLNAIDRKNVTVLSGVFRERMDVNRAYLMELDSQCLLQNFYLEAGIIMPGLQVVDDPAAAKLHWGWEAPTCQLRGHFLGHWLSAAAAYVSGENDAELKAKLDKIVSELARCQRLNGGEWIGSIPEKYFEMLAKGSYVWSPQYVMHKTIMGLTDVCRYLGNEQALEIVDHLSDWYIRWTDEMLESDPNAIYGGEQAGMLEMWAELYAITGCEKYMLLAERYWDNGLFRTLEKGADALTNDHANASIPLSHGAARLYEVTGDEKWLERTKLFWKNAVTDRGMYCTGGQNAGEFWIPPFKQGQFLGANDQEFCTVYNMVRTADYLYKFTGGEEYADYIERCLYNGFLAQQNPETGTPTYFLPLGSGSRKKWGSKRHDFWCCHGTMVQAQTLYPELIYFTDGSERLVVSQYIPSRLKLQMGGADVCVEQTTDMKSYNCQTFFDEHGSGEMSRWSLKFTVTAEREQSFTLSLRVPRWVKGEPVVEINGESVKPDISEGYMNIAKAWSRDEIRVFFPSAVTAESLADAPELAAFVDGPIVLAGLTDCDCGITGDFDKPEEILSPRTEHIYGTFPWKQNCYVTKNQAKNIMFKPLYEIVDETYTIYFTKK